MASLNKVFLMGRLTRDPELRYTPQGTAVVSFRMAISRNWTTPTGESKEDTCFVDINMFGRRAEVISQYFSKGDPIFIEGRLQYRQWESKEGQKMSAHRVIAENFEFVGTTKKRIPETGVEPANPQKPDINEEEIPF
ncbi:MAG TPA: single-stranded DNA-binding protein [Candidatus Hypogeohydataceae bacterium YC41]